MAALACSICHVASQQSGLVKQSITTRHVEQKALTGLHHKSPSHTTLPAETLNGEELQEAQRQPKAMGPRHRPMPRHKQIPSAAGALSPTRSAEVGWTEESRPLEPPEKTATAEKERSPRNMHNAQKATAMATSRCGPGPRG